MLGLEGARTRKRHNEDGIALVTVLVVMLVGFVIAATIATSVVAAIRSNVGNRSATQAFIAAESGRDAALAHLADSCDDSLHPIDSSGALEYSATIYVTDGAQPSGSESSGLSQGCPTPDTKFVVISSTGTGPNGSSTTVDAVYPWIVTWEQQAGGVLAYFASGVSLRGTYAGDIVVRSGDYSCAAEGTLDGDLYVTRGRAIFSRDCTVYGDVWTYGDIDGASQRINITGNVKAGAHSRRGEFSKPMLPSPRTARRSEPRQILRPGPSR
jgi:Tfp pilus assembly protein PilX